MRWLFRIHHPGAEWGGETRRVRRRARACLPASVPATPSEPDMIDRDRSKTRRARDAECARRDPSERAARFLEAVNSGQTCSNTITTCAVATYYFLRASPLAPVACASHVSISEPRAMTHPPPRPRPLPLTLRGGGVGRRRLFPIAPLLPGWDTGCRPSRTDVDGIFTRSNTLDASSAAGRTTRSNCPACPPYPR